MYLQKMLVQFENPKWKGAIIFASICSLFHLLVFLWCANVRLHPVEPMTHFFGIRLPVEIPRQLDFLAYPLFLGLIYLREFIYIPLLNFDVFEDDRERSSFTIYEISLYVALIMSITMGVVYFPFAILLTFIGMLLLTIIVFRFRPSS